MILPANGGHCSHYHKYRLIIPPPKPPARYRLFCTKAPRVVTSVGFYMLGMITYSSRADVYLLFAFFLLF
jgi:hypothetical protein